jgi:Cdc6-like AAA superfamily ATPase
MGNNAIIVLDEIDKLPYKYGKDVYGLVYKFSRDLTSGLSELRISSMPWNQTNARDLSSFHPVDVSCRPYDATQLRDILEYRVEQVFYPNALRLRLFRYVLP